MGYSEMRGGMTMFQTVYLKMRITRCCGILVYKQDHEIEVRRLDLLIIDVTIADDGRLG